MELAEGTRERTCASHGGGGSSTGGVDRLSDLPDCLLHVIMSSLKARQVVQTCVLSTRWRHLWRSVPCLDVDIVEFSKGWDEFEDFAVNLMLRCNITLLDSFRMDIDRGHRPHSEGWGYAIQKWEYRGLQSAAWLRRAMKYCTPGPGHAISQRQGLDMRPNSCRLRRLHLCHILVVDSFTEHLTSVCRSLEDLELDHCQCESRSIASGSLKNLVLKHCTWRRMLCDIASPTLKTLVINGGYSGEYCDPLAISAPMIAYLHLDVDIGDFRRGISVNKMPYLDRASIHLRHHIYSLSNGIDGSKLGRDQSKLLCSLSNVTSLELSGVGTTVLGEEPAFQEFKKLRNLLLGGCDLSDDFRILRFFHRGSPNLEKVTLRHCKFPGGSEDKEGTRKPGKTSSSGCCCGPDFLRDENVKLEIIHKDEHVCDIPNLNCTTDAVPAAALPLLRNIRWPFNWSWT